MTVPVIVIIERYPKPLLWDFYSKYCKLWVNSFCNFLITVKLLFAFHLKIPVLRKKIRKIRWKPSLTDLLEEEILVQRATLIFYFNARYMNQFSLNKKKLFCNDGQNSAVLCQTAGWRVTDLRLALRPGTVSPAVARFHQAGLPLLHLGRTRPAVTLGSLDHCPPPPQFACTKADIGKKNYLFMKTATGMLKFDLFVVWVLIVSRRRAGQSGWKSMEE